MKKLDEIDLETIKKVSDLTITDYEVITIKDNKYIDTDNLITALEDMLYVYHHLEEELEDKQREIDYFRS